MDVLITSKYLYIIGRVLEKKGVNKGKMMEVVKRYLFRSDFKTNHLFRQIPYENIQTIGLSTLQDDYIFLQVKDDYTTLLESPLKTEMLTIMK